MKQPPTQWAGGCCGAGGSDDRHRDRQRLGEAVVGDEHLSRAGRVGRGDLRRTERLGAVVGRGGHGIAVGGDVAQIGDLRAVVVAEAVGRVGAGLRLPAAPLDLAEGVVAGEDGVAVARSTEVLGAGRREVRAAGEALEVPAGPLAGLAGLGVDAGSQRAGRACRRGCPSRLPSRLPVLTPSRVPSASKTRGFLTPPTVTVQDSTRCAVCVACSVTTCEAVDVSDCEADCEDENVNACSLLSMAFWISALFRPYADWTSPLPTKPEPVGLRVAALAAVAVAIRATAASAALAPILAAILVVRCIWLCLLSGVVRSMPGYSVASESDRVLYHDRYELQNRSMKDSL